MRWRGQKESQNVEDRRGQGGGFGFPFPGGGGMRFPGGSSGGRGGGGLGILGILIILGLMLFFGVDPRVILQGPSGSEGTFPDIHLPQQRPDATNFPMPGGQSEPQIERPRTAGEDDLKSFVSVVLGTTEDVWEEMLARYGQRYSDPTLVLFSGATRSACGTGLAQMGPFYCPLDGKVYIDLAFYRELKDRFHAPGDMAQAYVIAHEIGHHVQTLLGITRQVERAKSQMRERQANALQVRMELQADCFAGIWANRAHETKDIIEPGDIDEALAAASAIGDDRIQKRTQGYVVPDSFTHGSSEQRVRWFRRGFDSGKLENCDTFNAEQL